MNFGIITVDHMQKVVWNIGYVAVMTSNDFWLADMIGLGYKSNFFLFFLIGFGPRGSRTFRHRSFAPRTFCHRQSAVCFICHHVPLVTHFTCHKNTFCHSSISRHIACLVTIYFMSR